SVSSVVPPRAPPDVRLGVLLRATPSPAATTPAPITPVPITQGVRDRCGGGRCTVIAAPGRAMLELVSCAGGVVLAGGAVLWGDAGGPGGTAPPAETGLSEGLVLPADTVLSGGAVLPEGRGGPGAFGAGCPLAVVVGASAPSGRPPVPSAREGRRSVNSAAASRASTISSASTKRSSGARAQARWNHASSSSDAQGASSRRLGRGSVQIEMSRSPKVAPSKAYFLVIMV